MALFSPPSCIGLFFDGHDKCVGVKVQYIDKKYQLTAIDSSSLVDDTEKDADKIAAMVEVLKPEEETTILVSCNELATIVDLVMPKLNGENLRNALLFEIPKFTPMNDGDFLWGFRQVSNNSDGTITIRVAIITQDAWEDMIGLLGKIKSGIEMILPLELALDPILPDFSLAYEKSEDASFFVKHSDGLRYVEVDSVSNAVFPFDVPEQFDYNNLITEDENRNLYCFAFLLARYGLGNSVRRDKKTWLKLPNAIMTKRKQSLLVLNALLGLGIALIWGFAFFNYYQQNTKDKLIARKSVQQFTSEINEISVVKSDDIFIKKLETEMDNILRNRRTFASNLSTLSNLIDNTMWVNKLSWNGEKFVLDLLCESSDSSVALDLQNTGLFENVSAKKNTSTTGRNSLTLELSVPEKKELSTPEEVK